MAREHAQIKLAIWDDDDFRALSANGQHLYFVLLTSLSLSYCGVADWRPPRLAALVGDWTVAEAIAAANELIDKLYLLVDETTEEVLIRTFIRHDELMKQPKMAIAMCRAHKAVASTVLRAVIVHELVRLKADEPSLKGWAAEGVTELLGKPSVNPSTYPLGKGLGNPSVYPSGNLSSEDPEPLGKPSPNSLLPSPSSLLPSPAPKRTSLRSAPASDDPGAGPVVAAWVEAMAENGTTPTAGMRAQVGKLAKELLAANDPARVMAAARQVGRKGYATIDRELAAMNGRPAVAGAVQRRDPKTGRAVDW